MKKLDADYALYDFTHREINDSDDAENLRQDAEDFANTVYDFLKELDELEIEVVRDLLEKYGVRL